MGALNHYLSNIPPKLLETMEAAGTIQTIPANTEILRAGQYIKVIPVVLEGLVKVFSSYEDRELLLYYIKPQESCIMSFSAGLNNTPSQVYARTEDQTIALLLPTDHVNRWTKSHPDINRLFFNQFNIRYIELLDTINHLLFDKMDKRLYDYLKEKLALTHRPILKMSHREIANDLGTAREVITRVIKKLESEEKVLQTSDGIKLL